MKTSFINRPISGFIISIVFTIATSAFSFYSIEKFFKSEQWVEHTNMVRGKLESIISKMKDAETGQRGFLLTGNEVSLSHIQTRKYQSGQPLIPCVYLLRTMAHNSPN